MSKNPTISVIIPVYNRTSCGIAAVESVVAQDYSELELIVIDDGSSHCTKQLRQIVTDNGGIFISVPHGGVSAARNKGVSVSKGRWLAFLDSDDRWEPTKLSSQMRFHTSRQDCHISQCAEIWIRNGVRVNPKKRHAQPSGDAFSRSLELCCISPSAVFISRDLFMSVGGFDDRMRVCEDYELWLRITANHPVGFQADPLVIKYGGHADQLSRSEIALDRFRVFAIIKLLSGATPLTDSQCMQCHTVLLKKLSVLQQGAKKRGNSGALPDVYQKLLHLFEGIAIESLCADGYDMLRELSRTTLPDASQLINPVPKE